MTEKTKVETLLQLVKESRKTTNLAEALYYLEQQINSGLYEFAKQTQAERKVYIDSISQIDNIAESNQIVLPHTERLQKAKAYITTCSNEDFWSKGFPSFASFRKGLWSELTDNEE